MNTFGRQNELEIDDWVDFVYDVIGGMMFGRISLEEGHELLDSDEAFEEWRASRDKEKC